MVAAADRGCFGLRALRAAVVGGDAHCDCASRRSASARECPRRRRRGSQAGRNRGASTVIPQGGTMGRALREVLEAVSRGCVGAGIERRRPFCRRTALLCRDSSPPIWPFTWTPSWIPSFARWHIGGDARSKASNLDGGTACYCFRRFAVLFELASIHSA